MENLSYFETQGEGNKSEDLATLQETNDVLGVVDGFEVGAAVVVGTVVAAPFVVVGTSDVEVDCVAGGNPVVVTEKNFRLNFLNLFSYIYAVFGDCVRSNKYVLLDESSVSLTSRCRSCFTKLSFCH